MDYCVQVPWKVIWSTAHKALSGLGDREVTPVSCTLEIRNQEAKCGDNVAAQGSGYGNSNKACLNTKEGLE